MKAKTQLKLAAIEKLKQTQKERIAKAYSKDLEAKCSRVEARLEAIADKGEILTEALNDSIEANKKLVDVLLDNLLIKKRKGESTQQTLRRLERQDRK